MKFQPHVGIDIGSHAIKLAQLSSVGNGKFNLVALGQTETPTAPTLVELAAAKAEAIKKLFKDSRATSHQAIISLPESQVYTRVIEMPAMEEAEMAQAIHWQAEQYIPVPLADVVLKHQVLAQAGGSEGGKDKVSVLLIAAPNSILTDYTSILNHAGLETIGIETEILAVARSLVGSDPYSPTTLLVHLGAETTTLSILARGDLAFTQTISSGGSAIARAVAANLGLEINQAEEYKKSYGLDESKLEGKVVTAIKPIIELIMAELKRVLAFYETRGTHEPVKRVVLSGGTALLPGLVQYFTQNLSIEVQIGNPFLAVNLSEKQRKEITDSGSLYTTSIGLAQKLS